MISIHVPREGHDYHLRACVTSVSRISIHVPREGHDVIAALSMSPALHFNPRAPRGARRQRVDCGYGAALFQSTCPARGTTH